MAENGPTALPHFESLQDLVEFFDTHDMGDYLEQMPEADFEVDIQRKSYLVSVDADLMRQITNLAKSQQVTDVVYENDYPDVTS
jgi:hypothetical protein